MPEIPRLNGAIRALAAGQPAFVTFSPAEIGAAQAVGAAPYDAVVFEMEHSPYDIRTLRDCMQYMLDRAQIVRSDSLAAAVAPMVRIPPNGGELNQFIAKQVLDIGVYGIVWPHVSTVEEARNAVQACRYPRPRGAAYYKRADTWPLNPEGEVLVVVMCEEKRAIRNLPQMLKEVPGIGVVLIGEGDLSQDMGYPRQYEHPEVAAAIDEALAICQESGVPCGHPHVDANNIEKLLEKGFRWLMPAPSQSFAAIEKGLKASGRK